MASIDFNLHKIFVEGDTDQCCLEKILELKYGITFPHDDVILTNAIINCGGWTKIKNQTALIDKFRIENGGKNLIIFDADKNNNEGGFEKRRRQLNDIADELNINFDIFLFPNNEGDGALEDFYCSCFKKDMRFFENCWSGMIDCFEKNNTNNLALELPNVRGKIFSYVDLFKQQMTKEYENKKTKRYYFDEGLWEFDFEHNTNLKKLILFIENCGIVTNEQK